MARRIVRPEGSQPGEKARRGQAEMQVLHARERESVAGPDHQKRHRAGGRQRPPVAPQRGAMHREQNRGKKQQRGEFRKAGQSQCRAEKYRSPPVWPFHPIKRRQCRGANARGRGHVGGNQAGVRQHGRQGGEEQRGNQCRGRTGNPQGPQKNYRGGDPEERQNARPSRASVRS